MCTSRRTACKLLQVGWIMPYRLRFDYVKKPPTLANQGPLRGAGEMNRTPDLLITNELLYRLSYTG